MTKMTSWAIILDTAPDIIVFLEHVSHMIWEIPLSASPEEATMRRDH